MCPAPSTIAQHAARIARLQALGAALADHLVAAPATMATGIESRRRWWRKRSAPGIISAPSTEVARTCEGRSAMRVGVFALEPRRTGAGENMARFMQRHQEPAQSHGETV